MTWHCKINFGLVKSLGNKKICTLKHMFAYKQFQCSFGDGYNVKTKGKNKYQCCLQIREEFSGIFSPIRFL